MTRAELLDRLDVLLGGRTAEELIFGDVSTGAQDDLQRATDLARHMITRYGMSEALGLATFEAPRQALFLQVPTGAAKEYSEETARVIDAEIQQLLEAAHLRVRATLMAQRGLLEALGILVSNRAPYSQRRHRAAPREPRADTPVVAGTTGWKVGWLRRLPAQVSRWFQGPQALRWSQPAGGLT